MKKLILCCLLLSACTNTVKPENDSDKLIQLNEQPTNCIYLYKMDAEASLYSHDDAIRYLKNRIAEKEGNTFWLEKEEKIQNDWVMFGPEYKYVMIAHVYECKK